MTKTLYDIGLTFYNLLLKGSAPFHPKAEKWVKGRRNLFDQISNKMAGNNRPVIWFHCASLGEFEQGRPVLEELKKDFPTHKIALTFFSPSGYEVRKNYAAADFIFYLPLDTAANAALFIKLVQPSLAVFVKYEFWYYYLRELNRCQIPVISISAIFRKQQVFFRSYGGFYKNILKFFTHIFTQNTTSVQLLKQIGILNATKAGDTRFDRVLQTAALNQDLPVIAAFKQTDPVFIIGSSWPQDMKVLLPYIKEHLSEMRFIIAPHEINHSEISNLLQLFKGEAIRYSQATLNNVAAFRVLIIDNIGLLSSLYRYGSYAYIGGAFGKGLHNTLEAAVFGIPVFFGPTYKRFQEAVDLVELNCAFSINSSDELIKKWKELQLQNDRRESIRKDLEKYFHQQAGATQLIVKACQKWLSEKV